MLRVPIHMYAFPSFSMFLLSAPVVLVTSCVFSFLLGLLSFLHVRRSSSYVKGGGKEGRKEERKEGRRKNERGKEGEGRRNKEGRKEEGGRRKKEE